MQFRKKILLFLLCFTFKFASAQFIDTLFESGLPDAKKANAIRLIAKKWKIQRYGYGCVVTEELIDSINAKNNRTYLRLVPKYGLGWLDRYHDEIKREYLIEVAINDLVNKLDYIKNLEIANINPGAGFEMYPLNNGTDYVVLVDNWIPSQNWKQYHVYKLLVDYKRKKVKILKKYSQK